MRKILASNYFVSMTSISYVKISKQITSTEFKNDKSYSCMVAGASNMCNVKTTIDNCMCIALCSIALI